MTTRPLSRPERKALELLAAAGGTLPRFGKMRNSWSRLVRAQIRVVLNLAGLVTYKAAGNGSLLGEDAVLTDAGRAALATKG